MINLIMRMEVVSDLGGDIKIDHNALANTIRRTAHAIEAAAPLKQGDSGAVLTIEGRMIGHWIIE